ncbi:carboxyltransferase domain-containing protein, partial [Micromonospora sp. NPDC049679]|uniref:carboxyltransferase domain-containing protein n=1 Tax=Micromonospora sp. NPDC049679 TaxID=3155920 RepID=UPI0033EE61FD
MRIHSVGPHALLVEVGSTEEVEALHAELLRRRAAGTLPPVDEIVPAATTVLLDGLAATTALADELPGWPIPPVTRGDGPLVELPVRYDGEDLAEVAARWGVTTTEVGAIHSGFEYRVAFMRHVRSPRQRRHVVHPEIHPDAQVVHAVTPPV